MTADRRSQRVTDPDGAAVEILALPIDEGSLEELLRDLFEKHWDKITFGPLIQGAAWEIRAPHAPTHIGMLDGYLTVAFGASHFHLCIGPHKGPPSNPRRHKSLRGTARLHAPSCIGGSTSRERRFLGACASSTVTTSSRRQSFSPIPSSRLIPIRS